MAPTAPTTEIGHSRNGVMPWGGYIDTNEDVPELRWPESIKTLDAMRHDAQIAAILRAFTLPIRRYRWSIDPNGARDEVVAHVAQDMGLPVYGEQRDNRGRARRRFKHDDHIRHALLAYVFGHMFFEIDGEYRGAGSAMRWHMSHLAPRMPRTISRIEIDDNGDLRGIRQQGGGNRTTRQGVIGTSYMGESPLIEADRLVPYVPEREGGDWFGNPVIRDCYKNWLIKDRLLRVDATKHERNGIGVPVVEAPENATPQQIDYAHDLATRVRAGEMSGAGLPHGFRLRFVGTEGSVPDTLASVKYHDQQMGRILLEMFLELGTSESGSRALGSSFIDFFALAQEASADWYTETTTAYAIEPNVNWNWGEDEQAPRIRYDRDDDTALAVAELVSLLDAGAITLDDETEEWVRERYNVPPRAEGAEPPEPEPEPEPGPEATHGRLRDGRRPRARLGQRVRRRLPGRNRDAPAAATDDDWTVPLPDRPLRRQPYPHEVAARTDFAALEDIIEESKDDVVDEWKEVQERQVDELVEAIEEAVDAGDLTALGNIAATPLGADILERSMTEAATRAAEEAVEEAAAQGVSIDMPDIDTEEIAARAAATATLMAASISETAGRRALATAGSGMAGAAVADAVRDYIGGLSDTHLNDVLGGAMMAGANTGRRAVMGSEDARYYASELLDKNTCGPCREIDGTEYDALEDTVDDYPAGGYVSCAGGPRCRGTIVAVYGDEATATTE